MSSNNRGKSERGAPAKSEKTDGLYGLRRFCRSKRSDDPPGDPYHLSVGVHTPARHERMCRPCAAGRLHSGTGGLRYPGGRHPGHGHQTGPQPAQPTRNGFRNRTHGSGTAARRSPERGFAGGSQLPHPGLRLAHDLFDLHPGTGRPHRPTGDGAQHRQHPLPEQGRLRLRFDGHRADRSAARPPEHAVRTQHDGRRNKRLYPVALHLRRSAAGHGVRQRQHAEIPDFDLLQNQRTGRLLGRSLLFQDRRLLQEPLYR